MAKAILDGGVPFGHFGGQLMFVLDGECRMVQWIVIIAIRRRQRFLQQPLDEPAAPAHRNAALESFDKLVRKTDQQLARRHCGSTLRIDIDMYIVVLLANSSLP